MTIARRPLPIGLIVILAGILGACATGAASPPSSAGESDRVETPPASGDEVGGGGGAGEGGSVVPPNEGGGGIGQPGVPELVVPRPGQQMVHPVGVSELAARVEGRRVVLNARWWSGIEPCSVLDSVGVERDGETITVTLFEGTSDVDAVCIAIGVEKVTVIDLGELEPGTYTVAADPGDAAAIVVEVP